MKTELNRSVPGILLTIFFLSYIRYLSCINSYIILSCTGMHLFLSYTLSLNNYSLSLTILRTLILSTVYPSFSQTLTSFPNRNLIVFLSVCCSLVSNSFLYIAQSFLHFLSPLPSLKIIISLSAKTALLLETLLELVIVSMRCLFRQRTLRTITFF